MVTLDLEVVVGVKKKKSCPALSFTLRLRVPHFLSVPAEAVFINLRDMLMEKLPEYCAEPN